MRKVERDIERGGKERETRERESYRGRETKRDRQRERDTGMALRLVTGMPHSSNQKRLN